MKYGRGLKRTPPERASRRAHAHAHPGLAAAIAAGIRGAGQLTPCQRLDQGQTGTCHAHSAAAALWTAHAAAGRSLPFVPSPRLIASCTYADVRTRSTPVGAAMPPLTDDGADLADDAQALLLCGIAPIQAPTSDGRFSDCENDPASNVFPEPDVNALMVAGATLVDGEYQIPVDSNAPQMVAACIDAGIPVWLGTMVDTAFEELGPGDVAQPANPNDPNGGGHALYVSGYRTNAASAFEYRVENSWGSGWCDNGACWASEAWIRACWTLWPFAVPS